MWTKSSFLFFILYLLTIAATAQDPISARVDHYRGKPAIFLNNVPTYPMIYSLTDVPGGRWTWEEVPQYNIAAFCRQGIKLLQVDLAFDHIWLDDGTISTTLAQKQLQGALEVCPGAAIFFRLHVNPPKWWQLKNPQENTVYGDTNPMPDISWGIQRIIEDDEENPTRHSLASEHWKTMITPKLTEFLQKLQKLPEANSLAGIQVAGGVYGEWHYWGFIKNEPDFSQPMLQYFRRWLKNKYKTDQALQTSWQNHSATLATAGLPTLEERNNTHAGIFRDPSKERKTIDYFQAQQQVVVDDIIHFCKVVKENWPRPIITGAFYGYFYSVFGRETVGGHLELQQLLESPYIDYLSAPAAYYPQVKEIGDPYRPRSLIHSVFLHGKLWLDEMDQQPPLVPLKYNSYQLNLQKSIALTRRNVLATYTQGMGLWFYDFGPSGFNGGPRLNDHGSWGWWDEPTLLADIGKMKKLLEANFDKTFSRDADVLLVHSNETFYFTGSNLKHSYMGHWTNNWVPPAIYRSGVTHDVIEIEDMDRVDLNRYKCIVFLNTWTLSPSWRAWIKEKVATDGRHLVWLYAPGYSDGITLDKQFVENLTGIQVQKVPQSDTSRLLIDASIAQVPPVSVMGNAVDPLLAVDDPEAISYGTISGTSFSGFACKKHPGYTSWFLALPPDQPTIWTYIFEQTGAHIYNRSGDIFYSGGGVLSVHTAKGGQSNIRLKNGKEVKLQLPENSTTLIDPASGEILFGNSN